VAREGCFGFVDVRRGQGGEFRLCRGEAWLCRGEAWPAWEG
jgi:hypothetical protein